MRHALALLPRRAAERVPVLPLAAVIALLAVPHTGDGAGPADAMSGLLVVYCVILLLRERRRPLTPVAALVLGLPVAGLALAAMGASSATDGLTGLGRYLQVFVLVPATVLVLTRHRTDFRLLAWTFVGLAGWQGAVGVHQYATGTGATYQGEPIRAVGTFGAQDVMGMATVVALGVVCAVGLALGQAPRRQRALAAGCAAVLLLPLALSFSRGAWIATALTCTVQLVLAGPRRAVKAGAAVAAAAIVLMGGFGVGTAQLQERIGSIGQVTDAPDQSVVDRYALWGSALGMWQERPLTGVGLKNFPEYRDEHATLALSSGSDIGGAGEAYHKQALLSPHSMYLLVLSEQGLIGLVTLAGGWLALLVCGLRRLLRALRHGPAPDCGLIACGLLIWLLTDFVYGDIGGPSTVLTAMALGLAAWWALATGPRGTARPHGEPAVQVEEAVSR
ncbi:O-antigen ligase family protein [Streptomyces sp. SBST2-5]|uniref:O-antigen ligase family protein n=1 Tax=Streptomyces composti TaxID=2720025 RepID=A0ABX1AA27_9ACTN|nr:O-antigen ligase family protein [Streptomyces composti]NJP53360.1 O-antigen ligase family protein [Streptomyces composti]